MRLHNLMPLIIDSASYNRWRAARLVIGLHGDDGRLGSASFATVAELAGQADDPH
jgi:hypothetical protein